MRPDAVSATLIAGLALLVSACAPPGPDHRTAPQPAPIAIERIDPPAGPGALAPRLSLGSDGLRASWLEATDTGGHAFRSAVWDGERWGAISTVAEGDDFFANWADTPGIVESPPGVLTAHWLARMGEATYAYGVRLARSTDGGATWQPAGWLHADLSPTEHGFVSWAARGDRPPMAVWLDGRRMLDGGPMELRARVVGQAAGTEIVLDPRVCECCATAAIGSDAGVAVAYRGRTENEVRDHRLAVWDGKAWSEPQPLGAEGWRVSGCPVNGPALTADGSRAAAAWFTAAEGQPRVLVAFSQDGGRSFGAAQVVAGADGSAEAAGRVAVALDADGSAWVSWLARTESGADGDGPGSLRVRRHRPDRPPGESHTVASVSTARKTGFPQLLQWRGDLYLAWVEADPEPSRLAVARFPVSPLPLLLGSLPVGAHQDS